MRAGRSLSFPISLAAVSVALSIALLVGWTLLFVVDRESARLTWLLVLGIVSFAIIMAVVVLFGVFLIRERREGHRQRSFLDSVTHELKSPLASLRLGLETLGRADLDAAQRESVREMMLADVERLSAFVDDVLEASRAGHRGPAPVLEPVRLAPLVRRCADAVVKRHEIAADAIDTDVPDDLEVHTDATSLEVVLRNLLDNAVKYSDGRPRVSVSAARRGARVVAIEVRDAGIGIPREHLSRIFQRFYRVPQEAVRARRGTGLGLFVVAMLVERLGGRIEARSDGPGQGTCVRLEVPSA